MAFSPEGGILVPGESVLVTVSVYSEHATTIDNRLEFSVEQGASQLVQINADIHVPHIILDKYILDLGEIRVGQ